MVYRADQLTQLWFGLYNPMGTNNSAFHALRMADGYSRAAQAAGGLINRRNGCGGTIFEVSLRTYEELFSAETQSSEFFPSGTFIPRRPQRLGGVIFGAGFT